MINIIQRRRRIVTLSVASVVGALLVACQLQPGPAPSSGALSKVLTTDSSQEQRGQEWIGTSYPPLAHQGERLGFATLGDARVASHALIHVKTEGSSVLLLGVRSYDMAAKADRWTITDLLVVPPVAPPDVFLQYGVCGVLRQSQVPPQYDDVELDPEIVAVVVRHGEAVETEIRMAWRASQKTGTFSTIDPFAIACLAEG